MSVPRVFPQAFSKSTASDKRSSNALACIFTRTSHELRYGRLIVLLEHNVDAEGTRQSPMRFYTNWFFSTQILSVRMAC